MSMADDEDTIYVDVAARLDEDSAEQATGRLRDKLKDGAKGAGKAISDVLHSELAQEIERGLEPIARNAGELLAKELGSRAGTLIRDQLSGALKDVGIDLDGVIGKAQDLADAFGIDEGKVTKIADAFKDFKAGDTAKGFSDLATALEKVPGPVGQVAEKSKGLLDTYDKLKGDIKGTTDEFATFAGSAPKFAAAFEMIGKAAGPVAATLATISALDKGFAGDMSKLIEGIQQHDPGKIFSGGGGMMGHSLDDFTNLFGLAPMIPDPHQGEHTTTKTFSFWPGYKGSGPPGLSNLLMPGTTPGASGPPSVGGMPIPGVTTAPSAAGSSYTSPSLPSISTPADVRAAGAGVKNLFTVAQALQGTPYSQDLRNDCSGMVSQLAAAAVGLPPPSAGQRFNTTNEGAALAGMGFQPGLGGPNDFNVGWNPAPGNSGHTAATLPGGVNAEQGGANNSFTVGGRAAGANDPYFTQHAHLSMGGPGGGIAASPAGFGTGPGLPGIPGVPGMPGLGPQGVPGTTPGRSGPMGAGSPPNLSQHNSFSQQQQQQMGTGQGFGLTGGGLIGLLEQMPGMAASAAGGAAGMFGGGAAGGAAAAAWSDIAVPEMNLAAQKGGQMLAALATAPKETFGLAGGQMGAPSVNLQGGWIGKIMGSLLGSQFSMPNIAGATQPSKDPSQGGDPNSDPAGGGGGGNDPLNGNKQAGGQQQGGKPPPTGHKDDPIHVQQAGPQQGQPTQGAATSAMNATASMSASTV